MLKSSIWIIAAIGMTLSTPATAQVASRQAETAQADPLPALTVDQVLATEKRPLARRVLQMLKVMEDTVVAGKKPGFDEKGWDAYAAYVDTKAFRRVDIFGTAVTWPEYLKTLTWWAQNYRYTGYIRRISEAGNLVYVENIEHSSPLSSTGGDGAFHSIGVYKFDARGKIVDIEIYAQRRETK